MINVRIYTLSIEKLLGLIVYELRIGRDKVEYYDISNYIITYIK